MGISLIKTVVNFVEGNLRMLFIELEVTFYLLADP